MSVQSIKSKAGIATAPIPFPLCTDRKPVKQADRRQEPMLIEGWVPRSGLIPVFGQPEAMKTWFALDMGVHVAAVGDSAPARWRGGSKIIRRGQVLIYSAEDTQDRMQDRVSSIIENDLGIDLDSPAGIETFNRVHIIAPLSIDPDNWGEENAELFFLDPFDQKYKLNEVGRRLIATIEAHNAGKYAEDPARIVMLILDSTTSVTGFEITANLPSTNFTWAFNSASMKRSTAIDIDIGSSKGDFATIIIAHSPKSADPNPMNPEAGARTRLAGGYAWSSNVRAVIEVRIPLQRGVTKKRGGGVTQEEWWESFGLPEKFSKEGALITTAIVAKKNINGMSKQKLWLGSRDELCGAFHDLTPVMAHLPRKYVDYLKTKEGVGSVVVSSNGPTVDRRAARDLVLTVARWLLDQGKNINGHAIQVQIKDPTSAWRREAGKHLDKIISLSATKGGIASNATRDGKSAEGSTSWHVEQLQSEGVLIRKGSHFDFADADAYLDS